MLGKYYIKANLREMRIYLRKLRTVGKQKNVL